MGIEPVSSLEGWCSTIELHAILLTVINPMIITFRLLPVNIFLYQSITIVTVVVAFQSLSRRVRRKIQKLFWWIRQKSKNSPAYKIAYHSLSFLVSRVTTGFSANSAALAGAAVAVDYFDCAAAPGFAIADIIGDALDGLSGCGQVRFNIYFSKISRHFCLRSDKRALLDFLPEVVVPVD